MPNCSQTDMQKSQSLSLRSKKEKETTVVIKTTNTWLRQEI